MDAQKIGRYAGVGREVDRELEALKIRREKILKIRREKIRRFEGEGSKERKEGRGWKG